MSARLPPWTRKLLERARRVGSREWTAVVTVLVLAAGTRFYGMGLESLWLDEATTYHRSLMPLSDLVADAKVNHHNPAYFLMMSLWLKLGLGDNEAMLRAPSAFFGVLKTLAVYGMGRIAGGRWVALAAALVIVLNPGALAYDQEARMYALYALGASVAMGGVLYLLDHPEQAAVSLWGLTNSRERSTFPRGARNAWLAFIAGTTLTFYCHGTAAVFAMACSLVALVFVVVRPRERRGFIVNWVLANGAVILAFSPWLFELIEQTEVVANGGFWLGYPSGYTILRSLRLIFMFGKDPVMWSLVLALGVLGTVALRNKPLVLAALWMFTLLGPALLLLLSLRESIFMHRLFVWCASPFAVIMGAGLVARPPEWRRAVALLAFTVLGLFVLRGSTYYGRTQKPRWREALNIMIRNLDQADKVVAVGGREKALLEYYFTRKTKPYLRFPYEELPERWAPRRLERSVDGARTVWTIRARETPEAELARALLGELGKKDYSRMFTQNLLVERYAMTPGVPKVVERGQVPALQNPLRHTAASAPPAASQPKRPAPAR